MKRVVAIFLLVPAIAIGAINFWQGAAAKKKAVVASVTDVDLLIFPSGTPGELLATNLMTLLGSTNVGNLTYATDGGLQHTFAEETNITVYPMRVGGVIHSTFTQAILWDQSVTNTIDTNTNRYEGFRWTANNLTNATNVTVSGMIMFDNLWGYQNTDIPLVQTLGHTDNGYSVSQWVGNDSTNNYYMRFTAHGAGNPIARTNRWYYFNNRFTSAGDTNYRSEQLLIDVATGEFVGYATSKSDFEGTGIPYLSYFEFWDYLHLVGIHGGHMRVPYIAADWSNGRFPAQPFTIPVVTGVALSVVQTNIQVTWTALSGTTNQLDKSVNSGAWSALTNVYVDANEDTYTDGDISYGNTYSYRIRQGQAGQWSSYVTTNKLYEAPPTCETEVVAAGVGSSVNPASIGFLNRTEATLFTSDETTNICRATLTIKRVGTRTGNVYARIWSYDGTKPGAAIGTESDGVVMSGLSTNYIATEFTGITANLVATTNYCMVLRADFSDNSNYVMWNDGNIGDQGRDTCWVSGDGGTTWSADDVLNLNQQTFTIYTSAP